jgi:hypothetical protein
MVLVLLTLTVTEFVMMLKYLDVWMLLHVTTMLLQLKTMVLVLLMTSVAFVEVLALLLELVTVLATFLTL